MPKARPPYLPEFRREAIGMLRSGLRTPKQPQSSLIAGSRRCAIGCARTRLIAARSHTVRGSARTLRNREGRIAFIANPAPFPLSRLRERVGVKGAATAQGS